MRHARTRYVRTVLLAAGLALAPAAAPLPASAQTPGTLDPRPLPALANPGDPSLPAKELFGRAAEPAPLAARALGSYAAGCLAGAVALPVDGPGWRVMRVSRNRNWGHPDLVALLERLAAATPEAVGWPGLLVGDLAQPRGGPMIWGHASHQNGLDADVWLTPMPETGVDRPARETMMATSVVRADRRDVDPAVWTPAHARLIALAARERRVERLFVNAAIKKALCRETTGDRSWLGKVRPMWGHDYHMHIRMTCPAGETGCALQAPVPPGDGCDASLDWWFTDEVLNPRPGGGGARREKTLADLPDACRRVLVAD
ncbi:penicillin-insensitive murein endopeptidase [Salinarimonas chemoclinalis]|uniref:penicillin-insensitive murein endopeptidase n=1 Tax=Salinarimonas chemoclinalis TaxID=3241599 RepID=UPI0035571D96